MLNHAASFGFQREIATADFWPQAIYHFRELMTQRPSREAAVQPSITSPGLLLTQQAWRDVHSDLIQLLEELEMFLHCGKAALSHYFFNTGLIRSFVLNPIHIKAFSKRSVFRLNLDLALGICLIVRHRSWKPCTSLLRSCGDSQGSEGRGCMDETRWLIECSRRSCTDRTTRKQQLCFQKRSSSMKWTKNQGGLFLKWFDPKLIGGCYSTFIR